MNKVIKNLELDDKLNRNNHKQTHYNKVWYEIPHHEDYNMMTDLIEFVKSSKGYKYLFVIVDLYSFDIDFEPLQNKTAQNVLDAMLKCFKRNYVKKPYGSISTDGGTEFKSVFHKWIFDNNIYHKVGIPYRHRQQSTVESANRQITKIIMLYINKMSKKIGKEFTDWENILPDLRLELNKHRDKLFEKTTLKYYGDKSKNIIPYDVINQDVQRPKYRIGNMVHWKLDYPENFNMDKQRTPQWRSGDYRFSQITRKIIKVIFMETSPFFRYILEGKPDVSYSEFELIPSKEKHSKYIVNKIIGKKTEKGKVFYLVWFLGELKKNASYQSKDNLIEDGLQDYIDYYENEVKDKLAKARENIKDKQLIDYEKSMNKKQKIKPIIQNNIIEEFNKQIDEPLSRYNLRNKNKN